MTTELCEKIAGGSAARAAAILRGHRKRSRNRHPLTLTGHHATLIDAMNFRDADGPLSLPLSVVLDLLTADK